MEARRQVLYQQGEDQVDLAAGCAVVIVQDDEGVPLRIRKLVQEGGHERFGMRRLVRTFQAQRRPETAYEDGRLPVALVEGKPRDIQLGFYAAALPDPHAGRRGLAEAGGGGQQGQPAGKRTVQEQAVAEALKKPSPGDNSRSRFGDAYLRGQQG